MVSNKIIIVMIVVALLLLAASFWISSFANSSNSLKQETGTEQDQPVGNPVGAVNFVVEQPIQPALSAG